MNQKFCKINEIIDICDEMILKIKTEGKISATDLIYRNYKRKIDNFMSSNNLVRNDYAPCKVLESFFFDETPRYSVNLSEANMIRKTIIDVKHQLYKDDYEEIFISHREKDAEQVRAFINLLYAIGISRPTVSNNNSMIFCTSHPATIIPNRKNNLEEIRNHLNSDKHIFYVLWYTDNYFESQACLNEAGAIWAMRKEYQEILSSNLDPSKITGLLDKQPIWFRANDKKRLNIFKEQIEKMFSLEPLTINAWETARDEYIQKIENIIDKS